MNDLIDTTEMFLRTIFDLEEEGTPPLRARIVERLEQSGPTVSQTVGRMERDGLLKIGSNRNIYLSNVGKSSANKVTRKHRLAELLLLNVLNVPMEKIHNEACRWEHVMSEYVEKKIFEKLDKPRFSPFGNFIPALEEIIPGIELIENKNQSFKRLSDFSSANNLKIKIKEIHEFAQQNDLFIKYLVENEVYPDKLFFFSKIENDFMLKNEKNTVNIPDNFSNSIRVEEIK